jgi:hypothetical protein
MRKKAKLTITIANKAKGRFICAGSESLFKIRIRASEKETMIKVRIDPGSFNRLTSVMDLTSYYSFSFPLANAFLAEYTKKTYLICNKRGPQAVEKPMTPLLAQINIHFYIHMLLDLAECFHQFFPFLKFMFKFRFWETLLNPMHHSWPAKKGM